MIEQQVIYVKIGIFQIIGQKDEVPRSFVVLTYVGELLSITIPSFFEVQNLWIAEVEFSNALVYQLPRNCSDGCCHGTMTVEVRCAMQCVVSHLLFVSFAVSFLLLKSSAKLLYSVRE